VKNPKNALLHSRFMRRVWLQICISIQSNDQPSTAELSTPVRSTTELTTFAEVAPEISESLPMKDQISRAIMNPYTKQDVVKVLSRKYLVQRFTWSPSDAVGLLGSVSFPDALNAIPNIQDKLANFRWLRSDVTIEVRLNATPFHIGSLMISQLPRCNSGGSMQSIFAKSIYSRSFNDAKVMSASSMNALSFDLIRHAPTMFDEAHGPEPGSIGTIWIDVLNPLLLAGSCTEPTPITISIFASFKDPEVIGYGYTTPSPAHAKRVVRDATSSFRDSHKQSQRDPVNAEAKTKSSTGVISGVLDAVSDVSAAIGVGPFGVVAPIASMGAAFARSLGLAKPTTVATTTPVIQDEFRDVNYTHGLFYGTKMSGHPDAKLAKTTICDLKTHSFQEFCGKPMLLGSFAIDTSTAIDTNLLLFSSGPSLVPADSVEFYPTPVAFLASHFKNYRGGMKYNFQFITSQFVTARMRIAHWPGRNIPTSIEMYAGDTVSSVVDIRGDTNFGFTVPYLSPYPYLPVPGLYRINSAVPTSALTDDSVVSISLTNPIQEPCSEGASTIYCNVWISAAEDMDFQFLSTQNYRSSALPATEFKKQSVREVFNKPFEALAPALAVVEAGLICPEKFNCIEDICKRFWGNFADTTVDVYPLCIQDGFDVIQYMSLNFMYWRSAMRYKFIINAPALDVPIYTGQLFATQCLPRQIGPNPSLGTHSAPPTAARLQNNSPYVDFEMPWNTYTYCQPTINKVASEFPQDFDACPNDVQTVTDSTSGNWMPEYYLRACGDDLLFGYQVPPPPVTIPADGAELFAPRRPLISRKAQKQPALAVPKDKGRSTSEIDMSLVRKVNDILSTKK